MKKIFLILIGLLTINVNAFAITCPSGYIGCSRGSDGHCWPTNTERTPTECIKCYGLCESFTEEKNVMPSWPNNPLTKEYAVIDGGTINTRYHRFTAIAETCIEGYIIANKGTSTAQCVSEPKPEVVACECPVGYSKELGKICMPSDAYMKCINSGGTYQNNACVCEEFGTNAAGSCKTLLEAKKEWCEGMKQTWENGMCKFTIVTAGADGIDGKKCSDAIYKTNETLKINEGSSAVCLNTSDAFVNSPCDMGEENIKGCWVKENGSAERIPFPAGMTSTRPRTRIRTANYGEKINTPVFPSTSITISQ